MLMVVRDADGLDCSGKLGVAGSLDDAAFPSASIALSQEFEIYLHDLFEEENQRNYQRFAQYYAFLCCLIHEQLSIAGSGLRLAEAVEGLSYEILEVATEIQNIDGVDKATGYKLAIKRRHTGLDAEETLNLYAPITALPRVFLGERAESLEQTVIPEAIRERGNLFPEIVVAAAEDIITSGSLLGMTINLPGELLAGLQKTAKDHFAKKYSKNIRSLGNSLLVGRRNALLLANEVRAIAEGQNRLLSAQNSTEILGVLIQDGGSEPVLALLAAKQKAIDIKNKWWFNRRSFAESAQELNRFYNTVSQGDPQAHLFQLFAAIEETRRNLNRVFSQKARRELSEFQDKLKAYMVNGPSADSFKSELDLLIAFNQLANDKTKLNRKKARGALIAPLRTLQTKAYERFKEALTDQSRAYLALNEFNLIDSDIDAEQLRVLFGDNLDSLLGEIRGFVKKLPLDSQHHAVYYRVFKKLFGCLETEEAGVIGAMEAKQSCLHQLHSFVFSGGEEPVIAEDASSGLCDKASQWINDNVFEWFVSEEQLAAKVSDASELNYGDNFCPVAKPIVTFEQFEKLLFSGLLEQVYKDCADEKQVELISGLKRALEEYIVRVERPLAFYDNSLPSLQGEQSFIRTIIADEPEFFPRILARRILRVPIDTGLVNAVVQRGETDPLFTQVKAVIPETVIRDIALKLHQCQPEIVSEIAEMLGSLAQVDNDDNAVLRYPSELVRLSEVRDGLRPYCLLGLLKNLTLAFELGSESNNSTSQQRLQAVLDFIGIQDETLNVDAPTGFYASLQEALALDANQISEVPKLGDDESEPTITKINLKRAFEDLVGSYIAEALQQGEAGIHTISLLFNNNDENASKLRIIYNALGIGDADTCFATIYYNEATKKISSTDEITDKFYSELWSHLSQNSILYKSAVVNRAMNADYRVGQKLALLRDAFAARESKTVVQQELIDAVAACGLQAEEDFDLNQLLLLVDEDFCYRAFTHLTRRAYEELINELQVRVESSSVGKSDKLIINTLLERFATAKQELELGRSFDISEPAAGLGNVKNLFAPLQTIRLFIDNFKASREGLNISEVIIALRSLEDMLTTQDFPDNLKSTIKDELKSQWEVFKQAYMNRFLEGGLGGDVAALDDFAIQFSRFNEVDESLIGFFSEKGRERYRFSESMLPMFQGLLQGYNCNAPENLIEYLEGWAGERDLDLKVFFSQVFSSEFHTLFRASGDGSEVVRETFSALSRALVTQATGDGLEVMQAICQFFVDFYSDATIPYKVLYTSMKAVNSDVICAAESDVGNLYFALLLGSVDNHLKQQATQWWTQSLFKSSEVPAKTEAVIAVALADPDCLAMELLERPDTKAARKKKRGLSCAFLEMTESYKAELYPDELYVFLERLADAFNLRFKSKKINRSSISVKKRLEKRRAFQSLKQEACDAINMRGMVDFQNVVSKMPYDQIRESFKRHTFISKNEDLFSSLITYLELGHGQDDLDTLLNNCLERIKESQSNSHEELRVLVTSLQAALDSGSNSSESDSQSNRASRRSSKNALYFYLKDEACFTQGDILILLGLVQEKLTDIIDKFQQIFEGEVPGDFQLPKVEDLSWLIEIEKSLAGLYYEGEPHSLQSDFFVGKNQECQLNIQKNMNVQASLLFRDGRLSAEESKLHKQRVKFAATVLYACADESKLKNLHARAMAMTFLYLQRGANHWEDGLEAIQFLEPDRAYNYEVGGALTDIILGEKAAKSLAFNSSSGSFGGFQTKLVGLSKKEVVFSTFWLFLSKKLYSVLGQDISEPLREAIDTRDMESIHLGLGDDAALQMRVTNLIAFISELEEHYHGESFYGCVQELLQQGECSSIAPIINGYLTLSNSVEKVDRIELISNLLSGNLLAVTAEISREYVQQLKFQIRLWIQTTEDEPALEEGIAQFIAAFNSGVNLLSTSAQDINLIKVMLDLELLDELKYEVEGVSNDELISGAKEKLQRIMTAQDWSLNFKAALFELLSLEEVSSDIGSESLQELFAALQSSEFEFTSVQQLILTAIQEELPSDESLGDVTLAVTMLLEAMKGNRRDDYEALAENVIKAFDELQRVSELSSSIQKLFNGCILDDVEQETLLNSIMTNIERSLASEEDKQSLSEHVRAMIALRKISQELGALKSEEIQDNFEAFILKLNQHADQAFLGLNLSLSNEEPYCPYGFIEDCWQFLADKCEALDFSFEQHKALIDSVYQALVKLADKFNDDALAERWKSHFQAALGRKATMILYESLNSEMTGNFFENVLITDETESNSLNIILSTLLQYASTDTKESISRQMLEQYELFQAELNQYISTTVDAPLLTRDVLASFVHRANVFDGLNFIETQASAGKPYLESLLAFVIETFTTDVSSEIIPSTSFFGKDKFPRQNNLIGCLRIIDRLGTPSQKSSCFKLTFDYLRNDQKVTRSSHSELEGEQITYNIAVAKAVLQCYGLSHKSSDLLTAMDLMAVKTLMTELELQEGLAADDFKLLVAHLLRDEANHKSFFRVVLRVHQSSLCQNSELVEYLQEIVDLKRLSEYALEQFSSYFCKDKAKKDTYGLRPKYWTSCEFMDHLYSLLQFQLAVEEWPTKEFVQEPMEVLMRETLVSNAMNEIFSGQDYTRAELGGLVKRMVEHMPYAFVGMSDEDRRQAYVDKFEGSDSENADRTNVYNPRFNNGAGAAEDEDEHDPRFLDDFFQTSPVI